MKALRSVWASLIWLFVVLVPIQFYLAGHGAMEGAYSSDKATAGKPIVVMTGAWDPHVILGTLMLLISLLTLLFALAGRLPRRLLAFTGALFVLMIIQYILPLFYDSASTRAIAALHAVNALLVTGLAIDLAIRSRPYFPIARFSVEPGEPAPIESGASSH
jgi:Family of unknown function (DUF6220)